MQAQLVYGSMVHDSLSPQMELEQFHGSLRTDIRNALGPRAPVRRRKKRLAKKLAKRGGMLRCEGLMQRYYRAWPWLAELKLSTAPSDYLAAWSL